MADYLRFTVDEYQALCRAGRVLPLTGPLSAFQHALGDALIQTHPVLAARVAALYEQQVSLLVGCLEDHRDPQGQHPGQDAAAEDQPETDLSFVEWRAVSLACAVVALRDDSLPSFKGRLLQQVAHDEPRLAAKLARLSEGQVMALYQRVKSGPRWRA